MSEKAQRAANLVWTVSEMSEATYFNIKEELLNFFSQLVQNCSIYLLKPSSIIVKKKAPFLRKTGRVDSEFMISRCEWLSLGFGVPSIYSELWLRLTIASSWFMICLCKKVMHFTTLHSYLYTDCAWPLQLLMLTWCAFHTL